jgi:hypothetical protein
MEEGKNNVAGSSLDRRLGHRCSVLKQWCAGRADVSKPALRAALRGVEEQ